MPSEKILEQKKQQVAELASALKESCTGVIVNFFGEEANFAAGPAVLARETGAALHVVHSWFEGDGWGLSVSEPVEVTTVEETTQRLADGFADNIAAHPADWHMLQPEWNVDVEARRTRRAKGQ